MVYVGVICVRKLNWIADGGFFMFITRIVRVFDDGVMLLIVIFFNVKSTVYKLLTSAVPALLINTANDADDKSDVSGKLSVTFLIVLSANPNTKVYPVTALITVLSTLTDKVYPFIKVTINPKIKTIFMSKLILII